MGCKFDVTVLWELIEGKPCFWDKRDPNYQNKIVKENYIMYLNTCHNFYSIPVCGKEISVTEFSLDKNLKEKKCTLTWMDLQFIVFNKHTVCVKTLRTVKLPYFLLI